MVNQHIGNHGLGIFWCGQIRRWSKVKSNHTRRPPAHPNLRVLHILPIIGPRGLQSETNL